MNCKGIVSLVGAGPGDPELLTVRALRALLDCDVLVYDRLVGAGIVDLAPPTARRIAVGKCAGNHPVPQHEINRILVDHAMRGEQVVRLKGGDPFIFGRGSEEAAELRRHGIEVRVVPGITAAQGLSASTGIPLTHRGLATGVRYVTGHRKGNEPLDLDWQSLADPETTLVVYMGLANITRIAEQLVRAGLPADTPVLAVSKATTSEETRLSMRLGQIADRALVPMLPSPVLFLIGRVAGLAQEAEAVLPQVMADLPCSAEARNG
ncbi:uroporphyrinogen-III C-methyltransferase [Palleronia caenipelagi]|uniref:uroporphyrinogen-III C-methyltransferase n=1 Tax=Palleronia caenipelagi TaxID=2489174 RepID=A0A547QA92_9RHOB|nr:uroporphyrinogen-III C-methyltransferase [Palleronia caenipelagi]TRD23236.1 uroporphyrinogen-III C-methyltransferase [Palleronia caenipelagi]